MSQVTVAERILVHLAAYVRFLDAFECPHETTQDGIARSLGISRAHAALELKRLRTSAHIEERVAHVASGRARRKVYFLTPAGAALARALRDHAREKTVLLADGPERREVRGEEAIGALRACGLREADATRIVLAGDIVDLRACPRPGVLRELPPVAEPFVDRGEELEALRGWLRSPDPLALVLGVAGVGKTAIAARAAREFEGHVWYRRVYGFDDARTFAAAVGDFLQRIDRPRLRSYLAGGGFDADDLRVLLRQDLKGVLVVADDVHASPEVASFLRFLVDSGGGPKVLATSRERPEALVGGGDPATEILLGGLSADGSRALALGLLDGHEERAARIAAISRGHPMALRLLAAGGTEAGRIGAEQLLEDAVLEGMDAELERAAGALAVLRKPARRPVDLGIATSQIRRLVRRGLATNGGKGYALHELARDVLLPRIPPASLRAVHRAAARVAQARGDAIEAAFHLLEAGLPGCARDTLLGAGADLLDSASVGELARLLERVPESPRSRLLLADALDRLGRGDEARALARTLTENPRHPLRADALLLMGRIASRRNALAEARSFLEAAIVASAARGDAACEGRARRVLALVHRKAGDLDLAEGELGRAIPLLETFGDAKDRLRAGLDHAVIRLQRGDPAAGAALEALLGDPGLGPREEAAILSNLAIVRARASRPAEAAGLFEESAKAAERGGDFRTAGYALANAADAYLAAGRVPEAEASARRAREVSRGFEDPLLESTILTNEGKVLAAQGRAGPAEERLRQGVERIRDAGNVLSLAERVRELAEFYEGAGRTEEAERWRRESEGLRRNGAMVEVTVSGP